VLTFPTLIGTQSTLIMAPKMDSFRAERLMYTHGFFVILASLHTIRKHSRSPASL